MRISDWSSDVCSSDLHQFRRQPGKVEIAAEPAFRDIDPLGHHLLAPLIIGVERAQIVARALQIGEIVARPILEVSETEGHLVGKATDIDEKAEIRTVVGAQPTDRPMPARAANYLEIEGQIRSEEDTSEI